MSERKLKTKDNPYLVLLQDSRAELILNFLQGNEPDFLQKHANLIDDYFRQSYENSQVGQKLVINQNPYAIIALGGYGRCEQCIHSDVDVLFLFMKQISNDAEDLIREILYPLWDLNLEIGHAARSINDCISLARNDFEVLTSLMDARFICGSSILYSELIEKMQRGIIKRKPKKIIDWLVESNLERHRCFGDSASLLEPNLKEGQGGLRDYHTILWLSRINLEIRTPRDLEYNGFFSNDEFLELKDSLVFIYIIRNRLHQEAGRKCDKLSFAYQIKLAEQLGFREMGGQKPVERFLGELHGKMEYLKQLHLMFLYEKRFAKKYFHFKKLQKSSNTKGIIIIRDRLQFSSATKIISSPVLLIKIFEESARLKLPLGSEANRIVREFNPLIDSDFISSKPVIKSFENILLSPAPNFNVLNEMLRTGFLECFIPEFKELVNRIQYDQYHIFPVDKHSLRTVQAIKKWALNLNTEADPLYGDIYKKLKNKIILLWAALLHDIGKGKEGSGHARRGAEIARQILIRKGYSIMDVETVGFLVENHLYLVKTATRRDLYDEETAIFCARHIKDIERLKMLYLLSVADSMATGEKAWNSWSASLLRELFFKVLKILEHGELATSEAVSIISSKRDEIINSGSTNLARNELETLFNIMSPRYRLYMPAPKILEHIILYKKLQDLPFVCQSSRGTPSDTRVITICAKDSPGLISNIAGVFTLNGFDILDTKVFTWRNNIALDIFKVKAHRDQVFEDEKLGRVNMDLQASLTGKLDLGKALNEQLDALLMVDSQMVREPNRVKVDNNSSSFFTIIEVFTYDFSGILYVITDAIFKCGLDIWIAKIATKIDQTVDVFYVRDFDGQKVDSADQVKEIKERILKVLPSISNQKGCNN